MGLDVHYIDVDQSKVMQYKHWINQLRQKKNQFAYVI